MNPPTDPISSSVLGKKLLAAGRQQTPPRAVRRRALAAAAVAASTSATGGGAAAAVAALLGSAPVKWVGIALVVAAVGGGTAAVLHEREDPGAQTEALDAEAPRPALAQSAASLSDGAEPADEAELAAPPAATDERAAETTPTTEPPSAETAAAPQGHPASSHTATVERPKPNDLAEPARAAEADEPPTADAQPGDSLHAELAIIDYARAELRAGQPAAALTLLDRYHVAFPQARFAPEAAAVRVEALLALGRRDEALALARTFLERYPKSPVARRMRSLLEQGSP